ncbi:hypothetical protein C3B44_09585 [Corynebacterium yudongzhengii]|uniref:Thioredoxin-like fold domain-containing protein n=1 Tax=Corynebacterium yudongzhengii TaxID=2080740 RepID=A0A2U1T8R6_9CORY|nr:thioredoxin domain-containing protein [Corynebacterium yudongzhengii]AWB82565.1 hypothetical protein C3B44_09585 [Corynebacterium yudongzhengii]PWC02379.1 hypothetical protein DF222_01685 [Corynebacterium yudongzhengii]
MSSSKSRSVSDPTSKGSSSFLWVIVAVLAVAAVVIGLVVWQSQGQAASELAERENTEVSAEMNYEGNTITLAAPDANDPEQVDLFEDFSCGYCAQLAQNTDQQMLEEIENGNLAVTIHPMNFMDNGNEGHSTSAAAATLALADKGETEAYWNLREILFEDQQDIFNQWDDDDFANAAEAVGASSEAVDAIRDGEYKDRANEVGKSNAETMQDAVGEVSTPRVMQDGEDVSVTDINSWIDEVLA